MSLRSSNRRRSYLSWITIFVFFFLAPKITIECNYCIGHGYVFFWIFGFCWTFVEQRKSKNKKKKKENKRVYNLLNIIGDLLIWFFVVFCFFLRLNKNELHSIYTSMNYLTSTTSMRCICVVYVCVWQCVWQCVCVPTCVCVC